MPYNVIIKSEAHQDVLAAFLYYEEKQHGLGEKFLTDLEKRYSDLSLHPYNYSYISEDALRVLRDVRLIHFPYVIVFEIVDFDVLVYAIHHLKSSSAKKLRKPR